MSYFIKAEHSAKKISKDKCFYCPDRSSVFFVQARI